MGITAELHNIPDGSYFSTGIQALDVIYLGPVLGTELAPATGSPGADPDFSERRGCKLFLKSLAGKIIAEKSGFIIFMGGCHPNNPSPKYTSQAP